MNGLSALIKKIGFLRAVVFTALIAVPVSLYAKNKVFIIGIVNEVSVLSPVIERFKARMAELGYIEGVNIKYVYGDPVHDDPKVINAEIKRLLSQKIDLLVTVGNEVIIQVKKIVGDSSLPIVAAAVINPVETGVVKSISSPGGNITGVITADNLPKGIEWLKTIDPTLKKICIPYNPDDQASKASLMGLRKLKSKLGVDIIFQEVHSVEEAITEIEKLEKGVYGIFRVPSPTLDERNNELSRAAIKRGIPMAATLTLDKDVLMTFGGDLYEIGRQTARLVHQIQQGVMPAEIPLEMEDSFLTINLKTAEKLGLNIPDSVLIQARKIIR